MNYLELPASIELFQRINGLLSVHHGGHTFPLLSINKSSCQSLKLSIISAVM